MTAYTINHDQLFKWLISAFLLEFFEYFFPDSRLDPGTEIDKEFYKNWQEQVKAKEGDLLVRTKVDAGGKSHEVSLLIEHKSWREDIRVQLENYWSHTMLMGLGPVWPIAVFSDDRKWKRAPDTRLRLGFSGGKPQYLKYDMIKISQESSR